MSVRPVPAPGNLPPLRHLPALVLLAAVLPACAERNAPGEASHAGHAPGDVHADHHEHGADQPGHRQPDIMAGSQGQTRYICPMHPEVVDDQPGRCPICGMSLVARQVTTAPVQAPAAAAARPAPSGSIEAAVQGESRPQYTCPMHPHIVDDQPGRCPICGMDLVLRRPVAAQEAPVARVSPAMQQSLGIRVGHPELRSMAPLFRVAARVVPDAGGVVRVSARSGGWVERLHVRAVGDPVRRGAVIAEVYAPELVQAQEELLVGGTGAAGARERLRRLGIEDRDIDAVVAADASSRRLPLRAPVDGVVAEIGVREGGSMAAGETVLEVAPRSQVWVEAMLFPAQRLQLGEPVTARFSLPGSPGNVWQAEASYIAPAVDPVTQTLAVRFPIAEAGDGLPLGLWLDAEVAGAGREDVLVVPSEAVIRSRDGARVVTLREDGGFSPVDVEIGVSADGYTEILSGLTLGQGIVLSGQFLLDSDAALGAGLQRMQAHDHADPAQ